MLIEVLLMLPVFLLLVFTVMETGHLAFRTILLHHAAYEVARIGSLTASAVAAPGCPPPAVNQGHMKTVALAMLPNVQLSVDQKCSFQGCLPDPQEGCPDFDVVVTLTQKIPMIFPMTGFILSNTQDRRYRVLKAEVRMPIERPLFK
ncbi:MAG: pilus assembly protein [Elusimicrobia bacterium]|nr:pilus assembly protein [Elusimicrobiota bacterium]